MASSSSSSFPASFAVPVSQEEFNLFHNIDRKLFTRLVFHLGRDPAESTQVMALWLWLERAGKEVDLVFKTLITLHNTLLNAMADETVMALNCIESDDFPYSNNVDNTPDIPIIQAMTRSGATLRFFHDNRLGIIRGVSKMFKEVCLRAFEDLLRQPRQNMAGENSTNPGIIEHEIMRPPLVHNNPFLAATMYNAGGFMGAFPHSIHGVVNPMTGAGRAFVDPFDLEFQRQILNNELGDVLSRLQLNDDDGGNHEQQEEVSADERTIFLTFSKGYPISENEVREFFTRKFGDFIDEIYMQEVQAEDQQPLYARLVVRCVSSIPVVLDGKSKAKFSINGKHVWARKYVRKNPRSPQGPSSPAAASQTSSP